MKVFDAGGCLVCVNDSGIPDRVYISLTLGIGMAARWLTVNEKEVFIGSATAKVYFNYLKAALRKKYGVDPDVQVSMNAACLYWESRGENCPTEIQQVLQELFAPIDEELFFYEKARTAQRYERNYKNLEFRGRMKMMEFSNHNKDFQFNLLSVDLLETDLKHVQNMREYLFVPENMFLFIHGKVKADGLRDWRFPEKDGGDVRFHYSIDDYHFLQDEAFNKASKGDYQCGCIKFERSPVTTDLSMEHAVLSIIGEILFAGFHNVEVDPLDASITYFERPTKEYKYEAFTCLTEEHVEKARQAILQRFDVFVERSPKLFTEQVGRFYFDKIDIYVWLEKMKSMSLSDIHAFLDSRDYKAREGYVNFYKERALYA